MCYWEFEEVATRFKSFNCVLYLNLNVAAESVIRVPSVS